MWKVRFFGPPRQPDRANKCLPPFFLIFGPWHFIHPWLAIYSFASAQGTHGTATNPRQIQVCSRVRQANKQTSSSRPYFFLHAVFDQDQIPKSCIIWHIKCWVPIRKNSGARLDFRTVTYAKYWKITVYWTPANQDTLTGHARRVPWLYLLFAVIFLSSRRPKWTEEKPPIPVRLIQVWSRTGQAAKRLGYRKLRTNCFSREETGNCSLYSTSTQAITDMTCALCACEVSCCSHCQTWIILIITWIHSGYNKNNQKLYLCWFHLLKGS